VDGWQVSYFIGNRSERVAQAVERHTRAIHSSLVGQLAKLF
jgi:hypothetical protein